MKRSNEVPLTRIVWKIFWAWQDYGEAEWLKKMSANGWHLKSAAPFRYTFIPGDPEICSYGIDYQTLKREEEETYLKFYDNSGWKFISSSGGYYYFRRPGESLEGNGIFSDNNSRIRKYRKILLSLSIISLPLWTMMITGKLEEMLTTTGAIGVIYKGAVLILIPFIILYLVGFVSLIRKIQRYKQDIQE